MSSGVDGPHDLVNFDYLNELDNQEEDRDNERIQHHPAELVTPRKLRQGNDIAHNYHTLTEEHRKQCGEHCVLFELLLLEENQELLVAEEEAVAHSVELEIDNQRNPFDPYGSSVIRVCPLIESFILDDLCLVQEFALVVNVHTIKELLSECAWTL